MRLLLGLVSAKMGASLGVCHSFGLQWLVLSIHLVGSIVTLWVHQVVFENCEDSTAICEASTVLFGFSTHGGKAAPGDTSSSAPNALNGLLGALRGPITAMPLVPHC